MKRFWIVRELRYGQGTNFDSLEFEEGTILERLQQIQQQWMILWGRCPISHQLLTRHATQLWGFNQQLKEFREATEKMWKPMVFCKGFRLTVLVMLLTICCWNSNRVWCYWYAVVMYGYKGGTGGSTKGIYVPWDVDLIEDGYYATSVDQIWGGRF